MSRGGFAFASIQYNMKILLTYCMALMILNTSCKKNDGANINSSQSVELKNVSYGADPLQNMDVYLPADRSTANTKALILIHGGAWVGGDKTDMDSAVTALKTLLPDFAIFNINYRLAALPSINLWPTQLNDVNAAVDFIVNKSAEYKFNGSKMAIGGASAGAHLALLKAYKQNSGNLKAVVDMFGPTDMKDLYIKNTNYQPLLTIFMAGTPTSNPSAYTNASPLFAVNSSTVPTILLHGTADVVVPITESDSLSSRLTTAGVINQYEKYAFEGHGFWGAANSADAYAKIAAFIKLNVK
jgi:acetyl esterase/lipase